MKQLTCDMIGLWCLSLPPGHHWLSSCLLQLAPASQWEVGPGPCLGDWDCLLARRWASSWVCWSQEWGWLAECQLEAVWQCQDQCFLGIPLSLIRSRQSHRCLQGQWKNWFWNQILQEYPCSWCWRWGPWDQRVWCALKRMEDCPGSGPFIWWGSLFWSTGPKWSRLRWEWSWAWRVTWCLSFLSMSPAGRIGLCNPGWIGESTLLECTSFWPEPYMCGCERMRCLFGRALPFHLACCTSLRVLTLNLSPGCNCSPIVSKSTSSLMPFFIACCPWVMPPTLLGKMALPPSVSSASFVFAIPPCPVRTNPLAICWRIAPEGSPASSKSKERLLPWATNTLLLDPAQDDLCAAFASMKADLAPPPSFTYSVLPPMPLFVTLSGFGGLSLTWFRWLRAVLVSVALTLSWLSSFRVRSPDASQSLLWSRAGLGSGSKSKSSKQYCSASILQQMKTTRNQCT